MELSTLPESRSSVQKSLKRPALSKIHSLLPVQPVVLIPTAPGGGGGSGPQGSVEQNKKAQDGSKTCVGVSVPAPSIGLMWGFSHKLRFLRSSLSSVKSHSFLAENQVR